MSGALDAFDFIEPADKLKVAEYCRMFPHAVLIFFSVNKKLRPVSTGVADAASAAPPGAAHDSESGELVTGTYLVFPVKPRDEATGTCTIGRAADCDIQIEDVSIAEKHATIELRGHSYLLVDHGSDGGSKVNGVPLFDAESKQLVSGSGVRLGDVDLVFLEAPEFYQFIRRFYGL